MKLEQQVTSLEISKKLKELGVKQESLYGWGRDEEIQEYSLKEYQRWWNGGYIFLYSAFTVAELGEMLPKYIVKGNLSLELEIIRSSVWRFYYGRTADMIVFIAGNDDTEADARGKMLIYLLENNLITL